MKPFQYYENEALVPSQMFRPAPEYKWVAYKNGEVCGTSAFSREDAEMKFNTKLVEKIIVNKEAIENFNKAWGVCHSRAVQMWHNDLLAEYSEFSNEMFSVMFSEAYDRGHCGGYDEVAVVMKSVVEYTNKIIQLVKEGK